ncbi:MAG: hypothetical protein J6J45_09465 [Clostridia bacterium]|nr:hypothetical protein [Clostridia bacterium]
MKYNISRKLHADFNVYEENKLPARSWFVPFSCEEALQKTDYKNERYLSDRVIMLSGEWDFKYYAKLSDVPEELNTDKTKFDKLSVPSTWQRTGYDQIAYINTRYPFPKKPPHIPQDVAVGIYRKSVEISANSDRRIISFLGVAGALALYVNGKYVGYSEGSHNTAEFDITPFVSSGINEILAVNYKWSNGSYLECQDMFRENGIFRDVFIINQNKNHVDDILLRPSKNADGTYDLKIEIKGSFDSNTAVSAQCSGLFEKTQINEKAVIRSLSPDEWTAETPRLYEAIITVESDGKTEEIIRTYIGFRDIKIDGEVFRFNSKAIKLIGVNHHDTHMTKGYAMSLDDLELDVKLMKEYNCNCVRTSHYPPDPVFLTMCDFYGLYVVDEADIETHGFYATPGTYRPNRLSNNLKWSPRYLDRVSRMYHRDKNHPSVTMWSLGNESGGWKCQDVCCEYLKEVNPEVPVHYEGVCRTKRWAYDVVSRMYASPALMEKVLKGKAGKKYKGKPFFQCEYAHAMGNGPGKLEEYMQLFYASEQFLGGCIWEWADHSVYDENAKYKWTYGGDHNEPIHDGNFCVDGLFFPDRQPSSGALEMKACYRPIRAKYLGNGKFELRNYRSFTDTSDIVIGYEITENGKAVFNGKVGALIPPESKTLLEIKSDYLGKKDSDIFVNFIYTSKADGSEIATEQVIISEKTLADGIGKYAEIENGNIITATFKDGEAVFDKSCGLISYKKNGKEYLNKKPFDGLTGFVPHIYRGRLDNDMYTVIYWNIFGLENAKTIMTDCKLKSDADGEFIRTKFRFIGKKVLCLAKASVDYRIDENGKIRITAKLKKSFPLTAKLPRFGVHCEFDPEFKDVAYYGRGPVENYSDFKEHSPIGRYECAVSDMAHKYIKPQDSGNRGDTRESALIAKDTKITFRADGKPFSFNANPFTLNQLKKAQHIEDLPDVETVFTAVDGFVAGTGTGSCGPGPAKEHTIAFSYTKPLEYSFTFEVE